MTTNKVEAWDSDKLAALERVLVSCVKKDRSATIKDIRTLTGASAVDAEILYTRALAKAL